MDAIIIVIVTFLLMIQADGYVGIESHQFKLLHRGTMKIKVGGGGSSSHGNGGGKQQW